MMSKVFLETMATYAVSFAIGLVIGVAIYGLSHKKQEREVAPATTRFPKPTARFCKTALSQWSTNTITKEVGV